ncbi:MAG: 4-hydroxythreonine-4-phosphate dehydrogenase PdxA [Bacteroidales bacterium]|nr:4-hydroxythreonine-4-phosphate dehydrogenase PdxA [Bacteroidales bacterium]
MQGKIKIGISHGDVNGISYEVIIKTLMDPRMNEICIPVIFGSPKVAAYHKKALDIENFSPVSINAPDEAKGNRVYIINCVDDNIRVELGKSTESAGIASYEALKAATDALESGKIDALVTGPINKQNIQQANFNYNGHTEYLQARFTADEVMMLMVSDLLKVGLVAGHVSIAQLSSLITTELIVEKLKILSHSLLMDFGIRRPQIAVLGLNPHAGENGVLGKEEEEVIIPAIEQAKKLNISAFGPFPADGFFGAGRFKKFDAVLAMYHDQGLAPFKTLSMDDGVNFTAGLPAVRTSPAHGTAYELAGKDEASEASFRNAIYLAIDVVRNRDLYKDITQDPLPAGRTSTGGKDESPEDIEAPKGGNN